MATKIDWDDHNTWNLCKGCGQKNHPYYDKRYHGYCLDCSNCGVPDRDDKIAEMSSRLNESWLKELEDLVEQLYTYSQENGENYKADSYRSRIMKIISFIRGEKDG